MVIPVSLKASSQMGRENRQAKKEVKKPKKSKVAAQSAAQLGKNAPAKKPSRGS